jgi:hypothetical protein
MDFQMLQGERAGEYRYDYGSEGVLFFFIVLYVMAEPEIGNLRGMMFIIGRSCYLSPQTWQDLDSAAGGG